MSLVLFVLLAGEEAGSERGGWGGHHKPSTWATSLTGTDF